MEEFCHGIPAQYSFKAAEVRDNTQVLVELLYKRYCLLHSIWRALLEKALTGNTVLDKTKIGMVTSVTEALLLGHIEWLYYDCAHWFLSGESQLLQSVNQLRELWSWKSVLATGALPPANFWVHSFELLNACSISYHWRLKWCCMVWVSVYEDFGILWDERLSINIQVAHKYFRSLTLQTLCWHF